MIGGAVVRGPWSVFSVRSRVWQMRRLFVGNPRPMHIEAFAATPGKGEARARGGGAIQRVKELRD